MTTGRINQVCMLPLDNARSIASGSKTVNQLTMEQSWVRALRHCEPCDMTTRTGSQNKVFHHVLRNQLEPAHVERTTISTSPCRRDINTQLSQWQRMHKGKPSPGDKPDLKPRPFRADCKQGCPTCHIYIKLAWTKLGVSRTIFGYETVRATPFLGLYFIPIRGLSKLPSCTTSRINANGLRF